MRKRRNFRKRPKDDSRGLSVTVWNNNVELALKKFKKKVKESGLMLELKKKQYYEKPSAKRQRKKAEKLKIIRSYYS